jgi:hypothetical protein
MVAIRIAPRFSAAVVLVSSLFLTSALRGQVAVETAVAPDVHNAVAG